MCCGRGICRVLETRPYRVLETRPYRVLEPGLKMLWTKKAILKHFSCHAE